MFLKLLRTDKCSIFLALSLYAIKIKNNIPFLKSDSKNRKSKNQKINNPIIKIALLVFLKLFRPEKCSIFIALSLSAIQNKNNIPFLKCDSKNQKLINQKYNNPIVKMAYMVFLKLLRPAKCSIFLALSLSAIKIKNNIPF